MGIDCCYEEDDLVEQFYKSDSQVSEKSPVPRVSSQYISENDIAPHEVNLLRIALLGDANCGKSKLV